MIDFLKRHASANVKESLQTPKNRLPVQNETRILHIGSTITVCANFCKNHQVDGVGNGGISQVTVGGAWELSGQFSS